MSQESQGPNLSISVVWPGVDELPVQIANVALFQVSSGADGAPEEILMSLGYVAPPVLLGTPQEQAASAMALGAVAARPIVRVALSRSRAEQLLALLNETLHKWDEKGAP